MIFIALPGRVAIIFYCLLLNFVLLVCIWMTLLLSSGLRVALRWPFVV